MRVFHYWVTRISGEILRAVLWICTMWFAKTLEAQIMATAAVGTAMISTEIKFCFKMVWMK